MDEEDDPALHTIGLAIGFLGMVVVVALPRT
jgi:tetrahydromethanopterin S-methyltransferase subunit F